jgi:prolyl oligopeptidase
MKKYILLIVVLLGVNQIIQAQEDKYLWLEEVDGKEAL